MASYLGLQITPDNLHAEPGQSVEAVVTVQNTSEVVDVFSIEVEGLSEGWHQLSTISVSLFPGDKASSTLTIRPPKDTTAVARTYHFNARVTPRKDPSQAASASGTLQIRAFHSFLMDLRPLKAAGAKGIHNITITNTGNADLNVGLEGRDAEELCHFYFNPQRPRIAPGEQADVALSVTPLQRPFRGRPKTYRFTVTGSPDPGTAEPISLHAELEATARVPDALRRIVSSRARLPAAVTRVPSTTSQAAGAAAGVTATPARQARRLPRWAWLAAASLAAVVVVVVLLVVLLSRGGGEFEGSFLLDPGRDVTYLFDLPDPESVVIKATAVWQGTAESLEITFLPPGESGLSPLPVEVSSSAPSASFEVDENAAQRGDVGWAINLKNTSRNGQAEGKLRLSFLKGE